ncbi:MAG: universal stress protein [Proteobacteria bacterium]|nr:universal stress protein [Pseudomonadota bacterium]
MYKHILVPTDGSELSAKAVTHGVALAKAMGAKLTVLTVSAPFRIFAVEPVVVEDTPASYKKRIEIHAAEVLETVVGAARAVDVPCETLHVEHEHPYEAILKAARSKGCDLIVMASHGRRGMSAVILGSETLKVLTHSKIPVLVYR